MKSEASGSIKPYQARSIPSLDGLRGVAVLLVVAAHLGWFSRMAEMLLKHHLNAAATLFEIDAGDLGVSTFFVISGFLITTLLIRYQDRAGRISLRNFYLRRFFRIFPPYYAYLLVISVLWAMHVVPMLRGAMISSALYLSNYFPYRLAQPAGAGWLVGHTWSLSLEEQFYLFWPACLHWLGRKRALLLGVALMLLAPVMRLLTLHLAPGYTYEQQMDRMFHTRVDTIMAGCVLALMGAWPPVYRALVRGVNARWTSLAALALLLATLHLNWSNMLAQQAFGLTAEAILLAYLISSAIANANTLGGRLLNLRGLRHLGVISYGLYLWQQLFDGPVDLVRGHPLLRLAAILAAAELSYHLVEKSSYTVRDRLLASPAS